MEIDIVHVYTKIVKVLKVRGLLALQISIMTSRKHDDIFLALPLLCQKLTSASKIVSPLLYSLCLIIGSEMPFW